MTYLCPRPFCNGTLIKDDTEIMTCILCGRNFGSEIKPLNIPEKFKKGNFKRQPKWI